MLIHALFDYAEAHGIGASPFRPQKISYRLILSPRKGFVGLVPDGKEYLLPFVDRSNNNTPNVGYDTAPYVLGQTPEAMQKDKYTTPRFHAFWEQLRGILEECGEQDALKAVAKFAALPEEVQKRPYVDGWVAITMDGDDKLLIEKPSLRKLLLEQFEVQLKGKGPHLCMVTGTSCTAELKHDQIKGVPGTGGGAALVSFHVKTSTQGRLEKGMNFPVSTRAMKAYTGALNQLIQTGHQAVLSDTTSIVTWGPPEASAVAAVFHKYTRAKKVTDVWAVIERLATNHEQLHFAILKGSKGRIAVLAYDVLPAHEIAASLLRFRNHFGMLVGNALSRVGSKNSKDLIDPMTRIAVVKAIMAGQSMPVALVHHLLLATDFEALVEGEDKARTLTAWLEYCGTLEQKVTHMRKSDADELEKPELHQYVIDDTDTPAYLLGRLVALHRSVRRQAHKRSLSNESALTMLKLAAASPAAFFERLTQGLDIYEAKIKRESTHYLVLAREVFCAIRDQDFVQQTTMLSLPSRAAIAQGYQHQNAYNVAWRQYWQKKRATEKAESTNEAAE